MKKSIIVVLALTVIAIIAASGYAYASFVLQSNSTHVSLSYQVSVETTVVGSSVNMKATVTNQGNPTSGIQVTFYQTDDNGNIFTIPDPNPANPGGHIALWSSQTTTDNNGVATATYSAANNLDTYFTAYATIQ